MKAIYRTHFEVRGNKPGPQLAQAVADICWKWLFDPKRAYAPPPTMPSGCVTVPEMALNASAKAEAMAVPDGAATRWVLKLTHPDHLDPAGIWRTELGIERTAANQVFFSCSLYLGRTDRSVAPFRRSTSRPKIVLDVLKQFEGYGALPLSYKPLFLKSDPKYTDALLKLLQDPRRQHPVVYVSTHEQSRRLFFDASRLADHLAGTAYVVVAENLDACRSFRQRMPPPLQAFDGAVRLYWPGFSFRSKHFDHPLWTKYRVMSIQTRSREAFSKKLLADIAAVAVTSMPESMLTWARIEEAVRRQAIAQARAAQDDQQLLTLYTADNEDLRLTITGLRQELQTKGEELHRAQARIAVLESATAESLPTQEFLPVETVADAIEQAAARWPQQLVFAPNSKSEGDDSPFQPATEVLQALEWLATTYHSAKSGKLKVISLDHSIRAKIPGWTYCPHQGDFSITRYKEWYQCQWEDRPYTISEHVGTGVSTKPEETIRIAFAWDKPRKKVVVGFIGQHQKTNKS